MKCQYNVVLLHQLIVKQQKRCSYCRVLKLADKPSDLGGEEKRIKLNRKIPGKA